MLLAFECFSYEENLDRLDLFFLEWRSLKGDMIDINTVKGVDRAKSE